MPSMLRIIGLILFNGYLTIPESLGQSSTAKSIDSLFQVNVTVLDSVAKGLKNQRKLTVYQTSFLYLIDSWSGCDTKFDHNIGFDLKEQDVKCYNQWYSRNKREIVFNDYFAVMEIQERFFKEGLVPESDLEYLNKLSAKYRGLSSTTTAQTVIRNNSQRNVTGKVIDEYDLSPIPEARIRTLDSVSYSTANLSGEFSIEIPSTTTELLVTWYGFEPTSIVVPVDCRHLEIILLVSSTYDYISTRRIAKKRYQQFRSLPDKHQAANVKGAFRFATPCFTYVFRK